ncbi:MAG: fluoride efflux transporter CrcB [Acidobacteriota bacterium]
MIRLLLVGLGGFCGSVLRYLVGTLFEPQAARGAFPIGTLAVNVVGCLAVGVLAELVESRGFLRPDTRALVFIGLLGGFTTFSTFANETVTAAKDGDAAMALLNVSATVLLCLGAAWAGRVLAHSLWR